MTKKMAKTLVLAKETLTKLSARQLGEIAGGTQYFSVISRCVFNPCVER